MEVVLVVFAFDIIGHPYACTYQSPVELFPQESLHSRQTDMKLKFENLRGLKGLKFYKMKMRREFSTCTRGC